MARLITADKFRERFDIDSDIKDSRITPHIGSASRRLRKWVGDAVYAATFAWVDVDEDTLTDNQLDQLTDLQNAEVHLAFHFAITGLNSPLSGKGVLKQAKSSESGGREIREYLTPAETLALSTNLLELASEFAKAYINIDPNSSYPGVVTSDESDAEILARC